MTALLMVMAIAGSLNLQAQQSHLLNKELLKFSFGRSKHGSGDLQGISFATEYTRYFRKKLSWSLSLGSTIHDGEDTLTYQYFGAVRDGSIRYTTAGFQGLLGLGFSVFRNHRHEVRAAVSGLLRYQTSSLSNRATYYPAATGLPFPVVQFDHWKPARTFALGASLSGGYYYAFKKGIVVGLTGAFQADLNRDVLSHLSLSVGKGF